MKYFLTVDWCNQGRRGPFCDELGGSFIKDNEPHTNDEMEEILGIFHLILFPQSLPFTEDELRGFNRFVPLAEYSDKYGIAVME
jgi:hypothetical protein